MLRRVPLDIAGRDVLELGCGTGKNTTWLRERVKTVVGLDFSPGMLAKARRRVSAPHVRFVRHDIRQRWPARDASIDAVVGNLVLAVNDGIGAGLRLRHLSDWLETGAPRDAPPRLLSVLFEKARPDATRPSRRA